MTRRIGLFSSPYAYAVPVHTGVATCAKRVGPWFVEVHAGIMPNLSQFLHDMPFDGVIAVFQNPEILAQIAASGRPFVSVGDSIGGFAAALHDNVAIGEVGAQHLLECGYTRCAYYGVESNWNFERFHGFAAAAKGSDLAATNEIKGRRQPWPAWREANTAEAARDFLARLPLPIGIMAADDILGRTLVDAAMEMNLRIPRDVAVIGVNNDQLLCETGAVALTSIDTNTERLGFEAALILDRLMRGEQLRSRVLRIAPRGIVQRASTSSIACIDPDIAQAIRYIQDNACSNISVDDVCEHLAISRRRLERRFREITHRSPGEEIRRVRMDRARALLAETDLSISEIAVRCGYSHSSTFATVFRATVGQTAAHYRRQSRGESDEGTSASQTPRA